ncbi:hypothetical protein FRC09_016278, partial [Ceratobasidium sp. 395]
MARTDWRYMQPTGKSSLELRGMLEEREMGTRYFENMEEAASIGLNTNPAGSYAEAS